MSSEAQDGAPIAPIAPILEIEDLAYSFGGLKAVNGSTFNIERGGINALIGPNGAGKTTLINIIAGALKAEAGRVSFDGTDVTGWPSHKVAGQGLIRTFQISRELANMTVLENMLVPPPNQAGDRLFNAMFRPGVGHRQDRTLVETALARLDDFGLYDSRDQYARNLSGGQKRLLELARGVMGEPKLMVLDEPFAGVNPALIELLEGHLQTLQRSGITFVMVEHNLNVVERICDHVVVMAEGRTLATGRLSELRQNEEVITAYLGGALTEHPHGATVAGEIELPNVSRGEPILTASGLTAGYSKVPVVQEVELQAEPGKVVAIVGPNGAGKSTMLKAMFGLLRNTSGSVQLAGEEISGWPAFRVARSGMAYVPQVINVFTNLSVVENLEMGAYTLKSGVAKRVEEVLEIFQDLKTARAKKAGNLSGGQRNMLGMARALMLEPKVVLLDEPTAGLSPAYTQVVWDQIRRVAGLGTAVIVVEQNVDLAVNNADWVYVLVAGRNRLDGPARLIGKEDLPGIFLGGEVAANLAPPSEIANQAATPSTARVSGSIPIQQGREDV
ncbi:MAG: ATP-binding cassette domain-containing protein [Candidatus Dormibacteraeota bacterium]|nr:ATP-binding cassette domain-containing protein [Candidatus Dormibacteraeota bacterium]